MKIVERYKCDYCRKITARKSTIEKHEKECVANPESVNCFRCEFACVDDWDVDEYRTIKDTPVCVYEDDVIGVNCAATCVMFRRSKESNTRRTYEDAVKNLEAEEERECSALKCKQEAARNAD